MKTPCETCGYAGPVLETHALYAVLQEEGEHAETLTADMYPNEQLALTIKLDELMHIVMAARS